MNTSAILDDAKTILDETIQLRRRIHRHPELGLSVPRTQATVLEALEGLGLDIRTVNMDFTYGSAFSTDAPEAYETLLLDVMWGDATLFMRADQIEASWSIVQPVLDAWRTAPPDGVPAYPAGAWGPQAADALPQRDGHAWHMPSVAEAARGS